VLSGRVELQYIICDGGSSDATLEIIEAILAQRPESCVTLLSEKDSGLYDALAKGLQLADGDICAYINAGDYYNEHAFDVVLDIFEQHKISWLTGMTVRCNDRSQIVSAIMPCGYRNRLLKAGFYGAQLPFVQQESTFWAGSLNSAVDYRALSQLSYAGDYFLWYQFADISRLFLAEAQLGTFRVHQGQISEERSNYFREIASFCRKPSWQDRLVACYDRMVWHLPARVQKLFRCIPVLRYNHSSQSWDMKY
jgi:glycosyltransferase involved in cell wall biosynthesis